MRINLGIIIIKRFSREILELLILIKMRFKKNIINNNSFYI